MLFPFTDLSPFIKESGGTLPKKIKDLAEEDALLPTISVNSVSLPDLMGHLIVASTSGLVLSRYYDFPLLRDSFTTLWVSNPLTRQSVKLPPNDLVTSITNKEYGFASRRDQSTDLLRYKVVVFGFPLKKVVPVTIFLSETGRWVSLEVPQPHRLFCVPYNNGFSHKGCLYFCCWTQRYLLTYNPYDSPDRFDRILLPPDSNPCRTSLVHSDSDVRCWEMRKCDDGLAVTVWRLGDAMGKPWWSFERRFRLPYLEPVCNTCMVALYPWDQDVICLADLEDTEMVIINQRRGTWESVDITYYLLEYCVPLINIHFTPWSSLFYAQS